MKKIGFNFPKGNQFAILKKGLFVMKITLFLILGSALSLLASGTYSQTTRVSLNLVQTPVSQVLKKIERSSEFRFLYNNDLVDVARKVDILAENEQINTILDELFANQNARYAVYDRQIVISPIDMPLSQEILHKISGKVSDISGDPLPGVSIILKDTTIGTIADSNGNFMLPNVPSNATLIFSFVGMKTQEVKVTGENSVNVKMEELTVGIDEVVAIGYGTAKKRDLTGAVSSISSKDIGLAPVSNMAQILQGKAAGVMVTSVGGSPGADVNVRIRGLGTVNGNDPLYVIDGIPSSGMNNLNPNDIESIDILKDASASAIYGSRAASGVVLITTKKGTLGATKISFETYTGVSTPTNSTNQLNGDQYYQMIKTANANGGTPNPAALEAEHQLGNNTNWWDALTQKGTTRNYFLSASGGTEKVRYSFSGGYFKQDGTIKNTDYDRISFRLNTDYNISRILKVGINLGITNSARDIIPEGWRYGFGTAAQALIMDPMVPVINPDANVNDPDYQFNKFGNTKITDASNPVGITARTFNKSKSFQTLGNAYFDLTLLDGLVYRMNFGLDLNTATTDQFSPKFYLTPSDNNQSAYIARSYAQYTGIVFENLLTYSKKFGNHNLTAIAAFTLTDN